jgi:TonB family protein
VRTAGFDDAQAGAPEPRHASAAGQPIGAFDGAAAMVNPKPGRDRAAGIVASAGFNSAGSVTEPRPVSGVVHETGFDIVSAPQQASAPPRQAPIDVPMEVLFKPTPSYSVEARALKLEGDVLLEVEFMASNQARVLRVVRGLGHGLDEAAIQAAEQIRFKPAQRSGRPVDFRTTVHIVFKLV